MSNDFKSTPAEHLRLQQVLARCGVASRRKAAEMIESGRVRVNGTVILIPGTRVDPEKDHVRVDGRPLRWSRTTRRKRTFLFFKPLGMVSTMEDPRGRSCLGDVMRHLGGRLSPAGRLDLNSDGLILLSEDGDLIHHVTHPRFGCPKTYHVRVSGKPLPATLDRLRQGIRLEGRTIRPHALKQLATKGKNTRFEVTLTEGLNNQIRRMFETVGHSVISLRRITIGTLKMEGLKPGQYRKLKLEEIQRLKTMNLKEDGSS